jgi:peroxiredoxin
MKAKHLFILVVLAACMAASAPYGGYEIGDTARDFELKNIDGKTVSLSDYEGARGYIVIFTCNTCPYSKMYEQRIIELHEKYASQGFPVVAINPNDPQKSPGDAYDKMIKRAKDKGFPFPYLIDETQEVTKAYGATNTPHVYVLNKERKVMYIGAIDNNPRDANNADKNYVEDAINAIKSSSKPKTTKTKAIGCTIKWAS